jgi:hypothetical protein
MSENRLYCDILRLKRDVLQLLLSYLTKRNALQIARQNPFRRPTSKELDRHPKLIAKQRRRLT